MLKSCDETVCWLARTKGVLVITTAMARLVDVGRNHGEGLSLQAARALTNDPKRAAWFDARREGGRLRLSLNPQGETYHRQLIDVGKCICPHGRGRSAGDGLRGEEGR